jgi:hypothetical protein
MSSEHVSGAVADGRMQWASIWALIQVGPSGSAGETMIVREGWRPVSPSTTDATRSPISPRPATTTRFITLERAATRRSGSPSSFGVAREIEDQIFPSSASMPGMLRARDDQRSAGLPITDGPISIGPAPIASPLTGAASGDRRAG